MFVCHNNGDARMSEFGNPASIGNAQYLRMDIFERTNGDDPLPHTVGEFQTVPHLVDENGFFSTGLMISMVDSIGGMTSGLASLPDWIVTTNLAFRRTSNMLTPSGTTIEFSAQVLRRGRSSVVTRIDARSNEVHLGTGWLSCAVLTPENGPPPFQRPVRPMQRPPVTDPDFFVEPFSFFNLERNDDHSVSLRIIDRLRNPWGILHGGSMAFLLDTAACDAVARATKSENDKRPIVSEAMIHYLAPGRVGPVTAKAEIIGIPRVGNHAHVVKVEVHDEGADNRLVTLAEITVESTF